MRQINLARPLLSRHSNISVPAGARGNSVARLRETNIEEALIARKILLLSFFMTAVLFCFSAKGSLADDSAEHSMIAKGRIMTCSKEKGDIIVNEMVISVVPSTKITDKKGQILDLRHLKGGQMVSVEMEPNGESGRIAKRIVLLEHQCKSQNRRFSRLLLFLLIIAARNGPY